MLLAPSHCFVRRLVRENIIIGNCILLMYFLRTFKEGMGPSATGDRPVVPNGQEAAGHPLTQAGWTHLLCLDPEHCKVL